MFRCALFTIGWTDIGRVRLFARLASRLCNTIAKYPNTFRAPKATQRDGTIRCTLKSVWKYAMSAHLTTITRIPKQITKYLIILKALSIFCCCASRVYLIHSYWYVRCVVDELCRFFFRVCVCVCANGKGKKEIATYSKRMLRTKYVPCAFVPFTFQRIKCSGVGREHKEPIMKSDVTRSVCTTK